MSFYLSKFSPIFSEHSERAEKSRLIIALLIDFSMRATTSHLVEMTWVWVIARRRGKHNTYKFHRIFSSNPYAAPA